MKLNSLAYVPGRHSAWIRLLRACIRVADSTDGRYSERYLLSLSLVSSIMDQTSHHNAAQAICKLAAAKDGIASLDGRPLITDAVFKVTPKNRT
jgi:hypothetical protein